MTTPSLLLTRLDELQELVNSASPFALSRTALPALLSVARVAVETITDITCECHEPGRAKPCDRCQTLSTITKLLEV